MWVLLFVGFFGGVTFSAILAFIFIPAKGGTNPVLCVLRLRGSTALLPHYISFF